MPQKIDPLEAWFGIAPEKQPPDHYRLLGLEQFEPNQDAISEGITKTKASLQKKAKAGYEEEAREVYELVKKAKLILQNPERKEIYDRLLKKQSGIKKFVAPERSARLSGKSLRPATTESTMATSNTFLSQNAVIACVSAMLLVTALGITTIILFAPDSQPNTTQKQRVQKPKKQTARQQEPTTPNQDIAKQEKDNQTNTKQAASEKPDDNPQTPETQTPSNQNQIAKPASDISTPKTDATTNVVAKAMGTGSDDVLQPGDLEKWESMKGFQATIEGTVQKVHVSRTGKTRYLYFTNDRSHTMVKMLVSKIGDELSMEYLESLVGKTVQVTGTVRFESFASRYGVEIQKQSQIVLVN